MKAVFFIIFCLFFNSGAVFASPISNRIFKQLHEYISQGEKKNALFYLRNHSRELVGTDIHLAKYAQGVLGAELLSSESKPGDYEEVEKQLVASSKLKELEVYIHYYKGLIDFKREEFSKAEVHLKQALKEEGKKNKFQSRIQTKLKEKIDYLYGQIDLKKGRGLAAYKKLSPLLRRWKGDAKRAKLLEILLEASIGKKLFSKGRYCRWFRELYIDHPLNKHSNSWGFKSKNLSFDKAEINCKVSLKNKRSKLRRYHLEGLDGEILERLSEIRRDRYTHRALLSSYYYYNGKYKKSLLSIQKPTGREETYGEMTRKARISYYAGQPEKSLYIYKKLYEKEKNKKKRAQILFKLANLNLELSSYKGAELYFQALLKDHKSSRLTRKTFWLLPWSMYLGGQYQEAYEGFISLSEKIKRRPYRFRGLDEKQVYYWAARALQKAGQESQAALIYKQLVGDRVLSYYSILSALRLEDVARKNQVLLTKDDFLKIPWKQKHRNILAKKNRFLESFKLSSRMPSALFMGSSAKGLPLVDLEASFPKKEVKIKLIEASDYSLHLKRYTYLSRMGFWSDANEELVLVKRKAKTKKLKKKLLKYFEGTQDFKNSSRLASLSFYRERHFSKPETAYKFWSKSYPKAYEEHVLGASSLFGVAKELIWGVMRAESFFDAKILSPVGARGLLQVMPYTGAKISSILSGKDPRSDVISRDLQEQISSSLLKPQINIRYGAKYLSRLTKQFEGHMPFVAAGYNAGPHRVKLWSKLFGDVDQDEFTERVPFKETRKYIKKVMRNMFIYRSLYEKGADMSHLIRPTAYVEKGTPPTAEYWGKL